MDILFRLRDIYDLYKVQMLLLLKIKEENGMAQLLLVFSYFWRYDWVNECQVRPTCMGKIKFDMLGSKLSNHVLHLR